MGLFGKIFEKKICDICGGEIGLLGNNKLADGNMCDDCKNKMSQWYGDVNESTIEEIKDHLDFMDGNQSLVDEFTVTKKIGGYSTFLFDEDNGQFTAIENMDRGDDWRAYNPDIFNFDDVIDCEIDVEETKRENPDYHDDEDDSLLDVILEIAEDKRYIYEYDIFLRVSFSEDSDTWLNELVVPMNDACIEGKDSAEYDDVYEQARRVKAMLVSDDGGDRERSPRKAPKVAVTCPHCGATTMPDKRGCCEYCGGALN